MNKERLSRLITQYQKNLEFYRNAREFNEQDCRDEFISPLLESFGWDVHNEKGTSPQYKEVVVEKFSNSGDRPDYTLTLNGVSKIFVEAKKPAVNIKEESEPAIQARRYGWNAKHKLSILTNFEDMMIYDVTNKPQDGDAATVSLYRKYHYLEYLKKYEEIYELISRESVYTGKYDEYVEEKFPSEDRYSTEVDEVFLKQINEWRLEIGDYLYHMDSTYRDIEFLNDVVQEFINQIIFLRICEDRNLPLYQSLKETAQNKVELQDALTKVFKEVDKKYNSKLFAGDNIIFDLNNEIIFNMILSLYYPKTPYMFNIIEPGILGKIYESFLTESLIERENHIILAAKKEYKYRSVVSTPVEIVKYMVKNTLTPICEEKTPDEIKKIQIADIACGSGIFLEEAYQFLVDYCTEWYMQNDPEHLLELSNGKKKLPLTDKKDILTKCIYGVDIDVHAVEVSKFSLLIKLIEDETPASVKECVPILPDLSSNIKNGNSLICREAAIYECSGGTAGYCAISKLPDSKYDLRYIQAWLNHPYTEKLFQIMGSDFEGGFTARGTYLLKKIPFVELDFNDKIQKALYESVLVSVKRIRELNNVLEQKKDKASVGVIEAEKENLSKRIEDDITKIYNLQF